jgi:hypothetical protein
LLFSPGGGGSMAKRLAKTPDYIVASHFVQSNDLEAAGACQFDQPKRLITPSPAVLSNRFARKRREQGEKSGFLPRKLRKHDKKTVFFTKNAHFPPKT